MLLLLYQISSRKTVIEKLSKLETALHPIQFQVTLSRAYVPTCLRAYERRPCLCVIRRFSTTRDDEIHYREITTSRLIAELFGGFYIILAGQDVRIGLESIGHYVGQGLALDLRNQQ